MQIKIYFDSDWKKKICKKKKWKKIINFKENLKCLHV